MGGLLRRSISAISPFVRRNRVDIALVVLAFALVAPVVAENNAQPASRLDLTAAIVEHHSVDISGYPKGVDYSIYHGLRSDKAPGQPVLATPFYAAERAFGAQSAAHLRQERDLTLWWITFWSAMVPFAALLVVMRRTAARYAPRAALPATVALGFGTLLMPYAANLYGHELAALLGFGAWSLLSKGDGAPRRLALVGLLAGLAVFVEYEAATIAAVLLVVAWLHFGKRAWWYVLGTVPGALALATYQWIAFGAPWATPYRTYAGNLSGSQPTGLRRPLSHIGELLWSGDRGVLLLMPIVFIGLLGAWLTRRDERRPVRDHAWIAMAVFAGYVLVVASSKATDVRDLPGPRFILASFPFLVVPLAVAWSRVRVPAIATACWGGIVMSLATFTALLVGEHEPLAHAYRHRLDTHAFLPTLWSMGFGYIGSVMRWLVVAAAVAFLVWCARREAPEPVAQPVLSSTSASA
jgi:hypothetical protein